MESKNGRQNTFRFTHHERDIVTDIFIDRGRALIGNEMAETSLRIAGREIAAICMDHGRSALGIDASGLLVLPGIIDLHGDAFERQMMSRPGVDFPIDVALVDSDRQAISNGITTIFHATTWSWEPGLRSADNARKLLEAIEQMRPQLAADTRFHLRHETYNLDAEAEIAGWLSEGRIDLFAFNDHRFDGCRPCKTAEAQPHGRTHRAFERGVRFPCRACRVPRSRGAGLDRPPGAGCARGECSDALA